MKQVKPTQLDVSLVCGSPVCNIKPAVIKAMCKQAQSNEDLVLSLNKYNSELIHHVNFWLTTAKALVVDLKFVAKFLMGEDAIFFQGVIADLKDFAKQKRLPADTLFTTEVIRRAAKLIKSVDTTMVYRDFAQVCRDYKNEYKAILRQTKALAVSIKAFNKAVEKEQNKKVVASTVKDLPAATTKGLPSKSKSLTDLAYRAMVHAAVVDRKGKKIAGNSPAIGVKEMTTAVGSASVLNKFFAKHKLNVTVDAEWGAASHMKVDMKWENKAEKTDPILKRFVGAKHKGVSKAKVDGTDVYKIEAKDMDYVLVYIPSGQSQMTKEFLNSLPTKRFVPCGIHLTVPQISFREKQDLTKEFKADMRKEKIEITDAYAQMFTEFEMDLVGARVKQYAMGITKSAAPKPVNVIIDKPFVAAMFTDEELEMKGPIFAGYLAKDSWVVTK